MEVVRNEVREGLAGQIVSGKECFSNAGAAKPRYISLRTLRNLCLCASCLLTFTDLKIKTEKF